MGGMGCFVRVRWGFVRGMGALWNVCGAMWGFMGSLWEVCGALWEVCWALWEVWGICGRYVVQCGVLWEVCGALWEVCGALMELDGGLWEVYGALWDTDNIFDVMGPHRWYFNYLHVKLIITVFFRAALNDDIPLVLSKCIIILVTERVLCQQQR